MKKYILFIILGCTICTAFKTQILETVNTKQSLPADYRDNYIGSYACIKTCYYLTGHDQERNMTSEIINIAITKDDMDSILQVSLGQQVLKVKLLSDKLIAYPYGGYYAGRFFAVDSIDFNFGPGRSSSCNYKGKKN